MATAAYLTGRKRYQRPQALLWSENPGTLISGVYVPTGFEIGATIPANTDESLIDQFMILSDHNRGELQFTPVRIEQRQRTINGRMRSYHIADKLTISTSWNMITSRSFLDSPEFNITTGLATTDLVGNKDQPLQFTTDAGAGGVEMLDWYDNHKGSFWVFLAYDKYSNFKNVGQPSINKYAHLPQYSQLVEMFFSDFSYTVEKRGKNFDYWNVSVTLEEV
jgi:hypothetical protein